ncbi:MAG: hypothetical protein FMNOHCHN_01602 [Ignavibacteriaceae bacterium]|nr:hypothetical protein [Ignavibacteriaceae bacterium]
MKTVSFALISFLLLCAAVYPQGAEFRIGRVKYAGGGDWYNDPSAEVNLLKFIQQNSSIKVKPEYSFVELSSDDIFYYPFLFLTGHGNIVLTETDAKRLRKYLESGGFLYVDDDYGLDNAFRRELKKVFPDKPLVELPFSHKIYNIMYPFPYGPPKTHKHDEKPPQGFGILINDRVALFYTVEANPSDGWADPEIHKNPPEKRDEALKFGANLVIYALSQ